MLSRSFCSTSSSRSVAGSGLRSRCLRRLLRPHVLWCLLPATSVARLPSILHPLVAGVGSALVLGLVLPRTVAVRLYIARVFVLLSVVVYTTGFRRLANAHDFRIIGSRTGGDYWYFSPASSDYCLRGRLLRPSMCCSDPIFFLDPSVCVAAMSHTSPTPLVAARRGVHGYHLLQFSCFR